MRSEEEILDLIVNTAQSDERIRAVIMNDSRVDPNARKDIFQDFDVVYLVTDVASFTSNHTWIDRFGEIMILQMPEAMRDPPPRNDGRFVYLMQFTDGNRIDLTLFPIANLDDLQRESLSLLLLDKDGAVEPFPPPNDSDHLPNPPTDKGFSDCCNEFWWVSTYVAKGLWREEILYAKFMLDQAVRPPPLGNDVARVALPAVVAGRTGRSYYSDQAFHLFVVWVYAGGRRSPSAAPSGDRVAAGARPGE